MYMILFVLDNPDRLTSLLRAWEQAGVSDVTIIESTGIHRHLKQRIPMRYTFQVLAEENHLTLLTVVKDQAQVDACLQATESVIGDLEVPNTGMFAAWPLTTAKGLMEQE
ncbi:MAG: hypothetical protein RML36_05675 [Anaerolineae bacterium]|nr:hypothetical protein [Anaerolineae bacterium]